MQFTDDITGLYRTDGCVETTHSCSVHSKGRKGDAFRSDFVKDQLHEAVTTDGGFWDQSSPILVLGAALSCIANYFNLSNT